MDFLRVKIITSVYKNDNTLYCPMLFITHGKI